MDEWQGEGWYTIAYSDGGQDFTNDGAVWFFDESALLRELWWARRYDTETHLAHAEYHGCELLPRECMSRDRNEWCDVDANGMGERLYMALSDLADAKAHGTQEDIDGALAALEDVEE